MFHIETVAIIVTNVVPLLVVVSQSDGGHVDQQIILLPDKETMRMELPPDGWFGHEYDWDYSERSIIMIHEPYSNLFSVSWPNVSIRYLILNGNASYQMQTALKQANSSMREGFAFSFDLDCELGSE